jgi:hypothetical protein
MMRTIIIKHDWWGGHPEDNKLWTGLFEDTLELFDYHTKDRLKALAEKDGYACKVIRQHRDGSDTVIKQSKI